MGTGKVSAVLAAADVSAIRDSLGAVKAKLPFLVALTARERVQLVKRGPKSVRFTGLVFQLAQDHPELLAAAVDMPEFEKDVRLLEALDQFESELTSLARAVADTRMAAGAEAMSAALVAYGVLRAASRAVPGLTAAATELGLRFRKGRPVVPPPEPTGG